MKNIIGYRVAHNFDINAWQSKYNLDKKELMDPSTWNFVSETRIEKLTDFTDDYMEFTFPQPVSRDFLLMYHPEILDEDEYEHILI